MQEVDELLLFRCFIHAKVFDGDVIMLFSGFLVFPIIFYYSFCFLQDIGVEDEIQHHYVNNNVLANEGGVGVARGMVHVNVITDVVQNNFSVDSHFAIMDVFVLVFKVFGFDVTFKIIPWCKFNNQTILMLIIIMTPSFGIICSMWSFPSTYNNLNPSMVGSH